MSSTDAKLVQVGLSDVALSTLPGSSAEISLEASDNSNTIFGNAFASTLPGVLSYTFSGNAWLRQTPGFEIKVKQAGVSTVFTDEPMQLVSGLQYIITDFAKSLWNYDVALVVEDNGVAVDSADIEEIDYMFGRVTFITGYVATGAITVTGEYFPTAEFGCANSVSLTQNAEAVDTSCFFDIQNANGFVSNRPGLKSVSAELAGFYKESNSFFQTLKDRETIIIEIDWEGNGNTMTRGTFRLNSTSQDGEAGGQEGFSASFVLSTPDNLTLPFSWYFSSTSQASQGMQDIVTSWEDRQDLFFRYYPEGTAGIHYKGQMVVTDASISGDTSGIPEMSLSGTGDGELVKVAAP